MDKNTSRLFTSCISKFLPIFSIGEEIAVLTSQAGRCARMMTSSHADITSHFCQPQVMRPMSDAIPAVCAGLLYLSGWHQRTFTFPKRVSQPPLSVWGDEREEGNVEGWGLKTQEVEQESAQWMVVNHVSHTLMFDIFIFNSCSLKTFFYLFH